MGERLAQELWGEFDLICKVSDDAITRLKNVSRFARSLAKASNDYAHALGQLLPKSTQPRTESETLGMPDKISEIVQNELGEMLLEFVTLNRELNNRVAEPLKTKVKDLQAKHKDIVKKGKEDEKLFLEATSRLNKARTLYYRACKQVDEGEKQKERPKSGLMQRLQDRVRGDSEFLSGERDRLRAEYQAEVKRANDAQRQWYCHDMVACVDALEELDRERVAVTKTTLSELLQVLRQLPAGLHTRFSSMEAVIGDLSSVGHLSQFVLSNRSSANGPRAFAFAEPSDELPNAGVLVLRGVQRGQVVMPGEEVNDQALYMELLSDVAVEGLDANGAVATTQFNKGLRVLVRPEKQASQRFQQLLSKEPDQNRIVTVHGFRCRVPRDQLTMIPANQKLFRVPLQHLVERDQKRGVEGEGELSKVPIALRLIAHTLFATGAEATEGVFRIPANAAHAQLCQEHLDAGADELNTKDPHVAASLFKLFLRQLPDPVVDKALYAKCVGVHDKPQDQHRAAALDLVATMGPVSRAVCRFVVAVLQRFANNPDTVQETRMDAANLAMVFSACLMRADQDDLDPMVAMANTSKEKTFVLTLIKWLEVPNEFTSFPNPIPLSLHVTDRDPAPFGYLNGEPEPVSTPSSPSAQSPIAPASPPSSSLPKSQPAPPPRRPPKKDPEALEPRPPSSVGGDDSDEDRSPPRDNDDDDDDDDGGFRPRDNNKGLFDNDNSDAPGEDNLGSFQDKGGLFGDRDGVDGLFGNKRSPFGDKAQPDIGCISLESDNEEDVGDINAYIMGAKSPQVPDEPSPFD